MKPVDTSYVMACAFTRWSPGIGDPNLTGWLTVLAYAVCAALALVVLVRARQVTGRARALWVLLLLAMVVLGINKQLDLQSLLTAVGRCVAKSQGWYEERRTVQRAFVEALLAAGVLVLAFGLFLLRRHLRQHGTALLGLAVVASFVAVRAVGFHHVDAFINSHLMDVRFNVILENAGLVLIALNAIWLLRRAPG